MNSNGDSDEILQKSNSSTVSMDTTQTPIKLPRHFQNLKMSLVEELVSNMLNKIAAHNDQIPVTQANLTRFHSRAPPSIAISDYLHRIIQFASIEKASLIVLLIYIDRICKYHSSFTISSLTIHRFMISGLTVISKVLCDSYCTNTHYAKVGGVSTQELNTLELEFLFLLNWDLYCDIGLLDKYYSHLVGCSTGFEILSADDLPAILDHQHHQQQQPDQEGTDQQLLLDNYERQLDTFDDAKYVTS